MWFSVAGLSSESYSTPLVGSIGVYRGSTSINKMVLIVSSAAEQAIHVAYQKLWGSNWGLTKVYIAREEHAA